LGNVGFATRNRSGGAAVAPVGHDGGVPLLEVIAVDATDARNAEAGGADRLELVRDLPAGGLSPTPATVAAVCAAVGLPVRVMVRLRPDFAAGDLTEVVRVATELRAAGAAEFVLGFLDEQGAVDQVALKVVLDALDGAPWTFHRAIDAAADRASAWRAIGPLPGLTHVLTAGSADGIDLDVLLPSAGDPRLLVGGGLRPEHLAPLRAAGATSFHTGTGVRRGAHVSPALVADWKARLA
jgi:copper homeostasis protein